MKFVTVSISIILSNSGDALVDAIGPSTKLYTERQKNFIPSQVFLRSHYGTLARKENVMI